MGRILCVSTFGFQLIPYLLKSNSLHHLRGSSPILTAFLDSSCSEQFDSLKTKPSGRIFESQNLTIFIT